MYVVTGVDGQFGNLVAELALAKVPASELIFTSWDLDKISHWKDQGVQVRQANFDNLEETTKAFEGGTRLLLISTMLVGPRRQTQHANAVQAAIAAGVQHIVYTSYLGSDDENNEAIVTIDHRLTEQAIFNSGLAWNIMRDSQYAEAMTQQQAAGAIASGKWFANQGKGQVAFVSRDDCARTAAALLLGAGTANTAYNVTGPELLNYRQVCEMVQELSGAPIDYVDVDDDGFYAIWDAMGVPRESTGDFSKSPFPWCSDDMVSFGRAIREGMMAVQSDAVTELTGTPPRTMRSLMEEAATAWPKPGAN